MNRTDNYPGRFWITEENIFLATTSELNGYICLARYGIADDASSLPEIKEFRASWVVPPAPNNKNAGHAVFLFNGMQPATSNSNEKSIIQPVLQWGPSAAGGGEYWSICCWQVLAKRDANGKWSAEHKTAERILVKEGNKLQATITQESTGNGLCNYSCAFDEFPATRLDITHAPRLTECGVALEAYGVEDCSQLPATDRMTFTDVTILSDKKRLKGEWQITVAKNDCGVSAKSETHGDYQDQINISIGQ